MEAKDALLCHDLKTERPDVSQGLPGYLRAVPVLFYISVVGALVLGAWFYLGIRQATASKDKWLAEDARHKQANQKISSEMTAITNQNTRARDVVSWMEGAHAIQPLTVAITRSMEPQVTISELRITRNAEIPAQLYLSLKLNGAGPEQLERTLKSIKELSYRAYSAQQTKVKDSLDYKATLIWENPNK